ncbi:MAG: ferritin family protein [Syntrophaceae bacterium]
MNIFDPADVVNFAIRIEENGERFYRYAAMISDDEETRYLFNFLADEEIKHKVYFQSVLSRLDMTGRFSFESYQGEYMQYVQNYLDRKIIFNKRAEQDFSGIKDIMSALNFAIDRESDSILYYSEIKNLVPKAQHSKIDHIIEEERKHFLKLSNFKKEITPK